jgi:hypothetical protein
MRTKILCLEDRNAQVGPKLAHDLIDRGIYTLEALRAQPHLLSARAQKGLEHYQDINTRIPRAEARLIEQHVIQVATTLRNGREIVGLSPFVTLRCKFSNLRIKPFITDAVFRLQVTTHREQWVFVTIHVMHALVRLNVCMHSHCSRKCMCPVCLN